MSLRPATAEDVETIAELHADSWRRTYRGAYLDTYLDGDVLGDRRAVWTDRLAQPRPEHFTILAEREGTLQGFAHTILDQDPTWGALLENLHVRHDLKHRGIGTRLLAESARVLIQRRSSTGLYLSVLEQNAVARAFYDALGGTPVVRRIAGPFPGGGYAPVILYAWPDPSGLTERA